MAIFNFDNSHLLGRVREVDTRRVSIHVKNDEDLAKAQVGQLIAIEYASAVDAWLIAIIDKVIKSVVIQREPENNEVEPYEQSINEEIVVNTVKVTLLGTVKWDAIKSKNIFTRSLNRVPCINANCYIIVKQQLESFMKVISSTGDNNQALELGTYTMDESAIAYIDGDKLFQRHAALLGSTGSGKSWTVTSILESASKLPSSNLVVFDLHGEYKELSYARQLRIPGPEELGNRTDELLYLPYWLLNADEIQAMFIDRSEFSAHNQVMVFQDSVIKEKKETLTKLGKQDILAAFTIDSPIPFSLENVLQNLSNLNEEMEQGARGLKQGAFYGQFSRLLTRIRSKLSDKRYGFLFQAPKSEHQYEAMSVIADKLMNYNGVNSQIKVIDFSEVPSDILPIIVGLVARMIYQIQFWTDRDKRKPLAFVCDEAHLYLPKKEGQNPAEKRALEAFEKIAKEGRKYGVSLLIVSQRPSDVSSTILSQCNNVIALRLTNSDDQNTVKKLMPESLESLLEVLPIMDIGEALVVGDAVLLPSRIKVNPPKEKPLSATIDFWTEWSKSADDPDLIAAVENMRRQGRNSNGKK